MGPDTTYVDDSLLVEFLSDTPKLKIIAALLTEGSYEVYVSQLAEMAGVARQTLYNDHLEDLKEWGIIEEGRKVGNSQLYRLNVQSPLVAILGLLQEELVFEQSGEYREDEEILESLREKLSEEPLSEEERESRETLGTRRDYLEHQNEL